MGIEDPPGPESGQNVPRLKFRGRGRPTPLPSLDMALQEKQLWSGKLLVHSHGKL
jgi:hypothetical protein